MIPPDVKARQYDIRHEGGDTFLQELTASDQSVLWGELLKESERTFFQKHLRQEEAKFAIGTVGTFQIQCHCCWQEEGKLKQGMKKRRGRFVTLLPGLTPQLNDCWAWLKLMRPLYKAGFSVVSAEFPGYGSSLVCGKFGVQKSDWWGSGWKLVDRSVKSLDIPRTHFVALGESCSLLFDMVRFSRVDNESTVAREHFWCQPVIDFQAIFKDRIGKPPPGAAEWWRQWMHETIIGLAQDVLSTVRIWMIYNDVGATPEEKRTYEFLKEATTHFKYRSVFRITEVSEADICSAQINATLPPRCLVLAKSLCQTLVRFLHIPDTQYEERVVMPEYQPSVLINRKFARDFDSGNCLPGCADLAEGEHLLQCPNHAAHRIFKKADGQPLEIQDVSGKVVDLQQATWIQASTMLRARPSSAPAQRIVKPPATLWKARGREGQPADWVMSTQGDLVCRADRKSARMAACLETAVSFRAEADRAVQHRAHISKLNKKQADHAIKVAEESSVKEKQLLEEEEAEFFARTGRWPKKKGDSRGQEQNAADESSMHTMAALSAALVAYSKFAEETSALHSPESPASPSSRSSTKLVQPTAALPPSLASASPLPPSSRSSTKLAGRPEPATPVSRKSSRSSTKVDVIEEKVSLSRSSTKEESTRPGSSSTSRPSTASSRPKSASRLNGFLSGALTLALRPSSAMSRSKTAPTGNLQVLTETET